MAIQRHIKKYFSKSLILAFAAILLNDGAVRASVQTVPTSLNPGDQYRLVFVTSTSTSGTASAGANGNTFVQARADAVPELADLGATWKMIGSTETVSAKANTQTDPVLNGPGVPIFLVMPTVANPTALIANNYNDLWGDVGHELLGDLNVTELGTIYNGRVWTGDVENGNGQSQYFGHPSGTLFGNSAPSLGTTIPVIPGLNFPGRNGWMFDWTMDDFQGAALYAMSSVLVVPPDPGVVPEPTSLLIWGAIALTCFSGQASRRYRND